MIESAVLFRPPVFRRRSPLVLVAGLVVLLSSPAWPQGVDFGAIPRPGGPAPVKSDSGSKSEPAAARPDAPPASTDAEKLAAEKLAAEKLAAEALSAPEPKSKDAKSAAAAPGEEVKLDFLELTYQGGPLMIPIFFFSVLVVALAFERAITLRRRAILPRKLVRGLKGLCNQDRGLDPREAYRLCQRYPSAAAAVIRAMLMKVDRPIAEIEQAGREASQREADRLSGGIRWLTLSAAVAPMLGLLGTVQGMILAFFKISHLPPGVSRAQELSGSIYMALVTTFAGLSVAIPAAVLAHLYGGRLMRLFRELEDILTVLGVQLDRYQRKQRVGSQPPAPVLAGPPGPPRPVPVPEPPPAVWSDDGKPKSPGAVRK